MSGVVLALHFQTPDLAPSSSIFIAAPLIISLGNHGGNGKMPASGIDGNEGQVGRADMLATVVHVILHPDFHSDFHRSAVDTIHRGAQDYQVADVHRDFEVEMINRCSHHV